MTTTLHSETDVDVGELLGADDQNGLVDLVSKESTVDQQLLVPSEYSRMGTLGSAFLNCDLRFQATSTGDTPARSLPILSSPSVLVTTRFECIAIQSVGETDAASLRSSPASFCQFRGPVQFCVRKKNPLTAQQARLASRSA